MLNWGSKLIIRVHTHMCSSGKTVLSSHTTQTDGGSDLAPGLDIDKKVLGINKKKKARKLVIIFKVVVTL